MEIAKNIAMIILLLSFPVGTALIAKSLNRKFWAWFLIGAALPFAGIAILLCLRIKSVEIDQHHHYHID